MSNPSKQKGTGGETELKGELEGTIRGLVRTPPTSDVDLAAPGHGERFRLLATRPDRGRWLISMPLEEFRALWSTAYPEEFGPAVGIEVKRHKAFAHHSIFEKKLGGKA